MVLTNIKKRDGTIAVFDRERIKDAVHKAFLAVELGDGEKAESVTNEVVQILERKFSQTTPTVEDAQDAVVTVLQKEGYQKVALEYQDFRNKKQELRALREKIGFEPKLGVNAMEVLKARYLLRDEEENIFEKPTQLFRRVAKAIAKIDAQFGEDSAPSEEIFNQMMAKLEFLPNTPTLFNGASMRSCVRLCARSAC